MKARSFPDTMEERVFYYGEFMNYLWFAFGFISCYIFFELAKTFLIVNSFSHLKNILNHNEMTEFFKYIREMNNINEKEKNNEKIQN